MATTRKPAAKPEPELVTVTVTPGFLLFVDGEQRSGTLKVTEAQAREWAERGWATVT
jgi:hypothetical protein